MGPKTRRWVEAPASARPSSRGGPSRCSGPRRPPSAAGGSSSARSFRPRTPPSSASRWAPRSRPPPRPFGRTSPRRTAKRARRSFRASGELGAGEAAEGFAGRPSERRAAAEREAFARFFGRPMPGALSALLERADGLEVRAAPRFLPAGAPLDEPALVLGALDAIEGKGRLCLSVPAHGAMRVRWVPASGEPPREVAGSLEHLFELLAASAFSLPLLLARSGVAGFAAEAGAS